jgi:hypothetical protein
MPAIDTCFVAAQAATWPALLLSSLATPQAEVVSNGVVAAGS